MKKLFAVLAIVLIIALSSILYAKRYGSKMTAPSSLVSTAALHALPTKSVSGIDTSHLDPGLTPPTNKWFSGAVLQKKPQTIFPSPLGVTPNEDSFSIGLPTISPTQNSVMGTVIDSLDIAPEGAKSYRVTRYDELSLDLTYRSESGELGVVTITAGSPYIQYTAKQSSRLEIRTPGKISARNESSAAYALGKSTIIARGYQGATFEMSGDSVRVGLPSDGFVTIYALATGRPDGLERYADSRIIGAEVKYAEQGNEYRTDIEIRTAQGKPTVITYLPHQRNNDTSIMKYQTLYGEARAVAGSHFAFTTPAITVAEGLDISHISPTDRDLLVTQLRQDINATKFGASDTYFSGKELYRAAQLLDLAKQLGESDIASTMQVKLNQELTQWLAISGERSLKYFYYDDAFKSIVGERASFGSEEMNDHHFHYGYFIYAASILARYDERFLRENRAAVDLLVADIANYRTGEGLPLRRSFDPYFGHSWASGSAPFADGNNQESTSEAINAWVACTLWARLTQDADLELQARWMLSNESTAASSYWLNIDASQAPFNKKYTHSLISLNWGGKRDYSTFFSPAANAKLGILLIPMNPTMRNVLNYGASVIKKHVAEATGGNNNVQFGDYILMYDTGLDSTAKLSAAKALPTEYIDGANSRSYLYAWILSQS